jgi:hypothetical protein
MDGEVIPAGCLVHVTDDADEARAAAAKADAAEKAKYSQTLEILQRLGLQAHMPAFV